MLIETLSTFPHMYDSVMGESMMKRAQEKGLLKFKAYDLRDWTHDRHRTTDDYPYGGGAGLVMKCEPLFEAFDDILGESSACTECSSYDATYKTAFVEASESADRLAYSSASSVPSVDSQKYLQADTRIIFLSPAGRKFDDAYAMELSQAKRILFVCGHYEGIDERVYSVATDVISLGDYVLTSGELASMVVIDAVMRKIPGVLGAEGGADDESFATGLLEYPQYTRPAEYRGMAVPDVLLSGNHAKIAEWRRMMSLKRTLALRPDLIDVMLASDALSISDLEILESFICGDKR